MAVIPYSASKGVKINLIIQILIKTKGIKLKSEDNVEHVRILMCENCQLSSRKESQDLIFSASSFPRIISLIICASSA